MTDQPSRADALMADLNIAASVLSDGDDQDRATGLVLRSLAGLIDDARHNDRPLGLLPHRAHSLANVVIAKADRKDVQA